MIKTISLNHKDKNLVNMNEEIKTVSLNDKGKNLINIDDKIKIQYRW